MSVFILFVIVLFNGQPRADYAAFPSMAACQAAKQETIKQSLEHGGTDGSFICTEHLVGKIA